MPGNFTQDARRVLDIAQQEAERDGRSQINSTDLLIGLLSDDDAALTRVLHMSGLDAEQVAILARDVGPTRYSLLQAPENTPAAPVLILDADGDHLLSNQAARSLLADHLPEVLDGIAMSEGGTTEIALGNRIFLSLSSRLHDGTTMVYLRDVTSIKQAGRDRDALIYTLVHDLRSPIAMILGWTELMQAQEGISEDNLQMLEGIVRACQTSNEYLNMALLIFRTPGTTDIVLVPCDLVELVNQEISEHGSEISRKRVELAVDISEHCHIMGETESLRFIVHTLIRQAILQSPNDGEVRIQLRSDDSGILLCVADHGRVLLEDTTTSASGYVGAIQSRGMWADGSSLRRMIEINHGTGQARNLPEGGVEYEIRFPAETMIELDS